MHEVVDRGGPDSVDGSESTAGGEESLLNGEEVILGVSESESVGGVGVGRSPDVRNTEGIPADQGVVGPWRRCDSFDLTGGRFGPEHPRSAQRQRAGQSEHQFLPSSHERNGIR